MSKKWKLVAVPVIGAIMGLIGGTVGHMIIEKIPSIKGTSFMVMWCMATGIAAGFIICKIVKE